MEFLWPTSRAPVWLLVRWMEHLGFSEPAVRAAVSRSAARGWLVREDGARAVYRLSARVQWQVARVRERLYGTPEEWDGLLRVLLYHVPEERRPDRDRFRKELALLGFGTPSPGVWVTPSPRLESALDLVRFYDLEGYVELFEARRFSPRPLEELIRQSFDLEAARGVHTDFLNQAWAVPKTPEAAFANLVRLVHQRRKAFFTDPGLPKALLPEPWPGEKAQARFLSLRETLYRHAEPIIRLREST